MTLVEEHDIVVAAIARPIRMRITGAAASPLDTPASAYYNRAVLIKRFFIIVLGRSSGGVG